jgi:hypothetical protein
MKIDVNPDVLHQLAEYCDEQAAVMEATRLYLLEHGKISPNDFGLLLRIARPFYELCRGFAMAGFGLGSKLVKARAVAMHAYIKEQEELEKDHTSLIESFQKALQQSGGGMGGAFGGGHGGTIDGGAGARPVGPNVPSFQDAQHQQQQPGQFGGAGGGIGGVGGAFSSIPFGGGGGPEPVAHAEQAQDLNPQPLPPGPPETVHPEALSHKQEVMDRVWQDRSDQDPLGRSPQRLQEMWAARQPVEPTHEMGLNDGSMQNGASHASQLQAQVANAMKFVTDTQLAMLATSR